MIDTDLPDWLYVGAPVATYGHGNGGFGMGSWSTTTVSKIGKRDIVLANGARFNVNSFSNRVGGTWGSTSYLAPRTDETFLEVRRERTIRKDALKVEDLMRDWLKGRGDLEPVRAAVEILSRYLSAEEISRD